MNNEKKDDWGDNQGGKISKKISEFYDRINRFKKSAPSMQSAENWFFAISAATLLWMLNSFDRFQIKEVTPFKALYIISTITLGLSTILFGIARILLFAYQFGIDLAADKLESFPAKARFRYKNAEEVEKKREEAAKRSVTIFRHAHNLVPNSIRIFIKGFFVFAIGLILLILYIVLFFSYYL